MNLTTAPGPWHETSTWQLSVMYREGGATGTQANLFTWFWAWNKKMERCEQTKGKAEERMTEGSEDGEKGGRSYCAEACQIYKRRGISPPFWNKAGETKLLFSAWVGTIPDLLSIQVWLKWLNVGRFLILNTGERLGNSKGSKFGFSEIIL